MADGGTGAGAEADGSDGNGRLDSASSAQAPIRISNKTTMPTAPHSCERWRRLPRIVRLFVMRLVCRTPPTEFFTEFPAWLE